MTDADVRFETFWSVYPRKACKVVARRAFEKICADDETLEALLGSISRARRVWTGRELRHVPHASTWLNQRRFEEDDRAWSRLGHPGLSADHWYDHCEHDPRCRTLPEHQLRQEKERR